MEPLSMVTSSILKHYEDSVIEKLIKDGLLDCNTDSIKNLATEALPMALMEEIKRLMNTYGLHRGTLTTDFIRSCPLIQSDDAKVRTSPNNKQRRMGVSERNEYDRYIFKVVFSYHLVTHVIDNYL